MIYTFIKTHVLGDKAVLRYTFDALRRMAEVFPETFSGEVHPALVMFRVVPFVMVEAAGERERAVEAMLDMFALLYAQDEALFSAGVRDLARLLAGMLVWCGGDGDGVGGRLESGDGVVLGSGVSEIDDCGESQVF